MQPFPKEFYGANSQKTNRSATPLSASTNYPPYGVYTANYQCFTALNTQINFRYNRDNTAK